MTDRRVYPATPEQLREIRAGKPVTAWEEDNRLPKSGGVLYATDIFDDTYWVSVDGEDVIDEETSLPLCVSPPYAPGEVLAVGEELLRDHSNTCNAVYANDKRLVARHGKREPLVPFFWPRKLDDLLSIPSDHPQWPTEAARFWVRVESVEPRPQTERWIEAVPMHDPNNPDGEPIPYPEERVEKVWGWAYTLTPCNRDGGDL